MTKPSLVCPGCTCLCDDVFVTPNDPLTVINACEMGTRWFQQGLANATQPVAHWVAGQACDLATATSAAAKRLAKAKAPLICGLEQLNVDAQQAAWKLADSTGATIDPSLHNHGQAGTFSLQKHGKVSATLGEIATRSDLVVFWFCDPETTHPRHLERYSNPANGPKRTIIVVDETETATAGLADQYIQLPKSNAAATLIELRALIAGSPLNLASGASTSGHSTNSMAALAEQLKSATYGAFIYGHATDDSAFDLANDQLALLVRGLNRHTRFVTLGLRSDGNAQSAENVLAWSSGYPFAVNYAQGIPRFNRSEHSAATVLARSECDLIVLGPGSCKSVASLPEAAARHFDATPKIELSSGKTLANVDVVLSVAVPGIDDGGDFCRQDDVALPLTKLILTERPSAKKAIEMILDRLDE